MLKIKSLNKAEKMLVGMNVPDEHHGNIGRLIEDILERAGYSINRGKGTDIPGLHVEIKTRGIESRSGSTIGKIKLKDIIRYSWKESPIHEKFQQQFRVHYSKLNNKIISAKMYDFRNKESQQIAEYSYESARQQIINGPVKKYIRGHNAWGYFENTTKEDIDVYDFRFSDNKMKALEALSNSKFYDLFDYE